MYEPQQRAPNLRVTALAGGVALAVVLPLTVATAGPESPEAPGGRPAAAVSSPSPSPFPPLSRAPSAPASSDPLPPGLRPEVTAVCGPRSTVPEGVRAQTCVLTRDGAVWGRMYYRNTTGEPLYGALSLLGPGGKAVHMPCELPAADRPGVCDTPLRRAAETRPDAEPYAAVAEIAAPDGEGLLLRSGSGAGDAQR